MNDQEKKKHFNYLVGNAFEFLERTVEEVESNPKFAIIHFAAAIEILYKARLFHEHWTLISSDVKTLTYDKFLNGDFKSVTLDEADRRLIHIVKAKTNRSFYPHFKEIAKHRNRIVHFYHEAHSNPEKEGEKKHTVTQLLLGFYYLQQLLDLWWRMPFKEGDWSYRIYKLHRKLLSENSEYVSAICEQYRPELEKLEKDGVEIVECNICKSKSCALNMWSEIVFGTRCYVCDHADKGIRIECPYCNEETFIYDTEKTCQACELFIESDCIASLFCELDKREPEQGGEVECTWCYEQDLIIPDGDKFTCMGCFTIYEQINECEYCGCFVVEDTENSATLGCSQCKLHEYRMSKGD